MKIDNLIYNDPFKRFKNTTNVSNVVSWSKTFDGDVFNQIITNHKPNVIIELGSFLGYSTINMLKMCNKLNLKSKIICVDTWLGGVDHYIHYNEKTDDLFFKFFKIENGISTLFDQFCINIVNEKMDHQVIPFPNTTDNAFLYFKYLGLSADLIFVDASHTKNQVYNDIKNYYELLTPNGVIFGHDINWIDIKESVNTFCDEKHLRYKTYYDKYWEIYK